MTDGRDGKQYYTGIFFAVLATIIWSGNFIIARGVIDTISPVSLAFYRWFTACIIMLPLAWNIFRKERKTVFRHLRYFFLTGLTGITQFNTFVYIAGHYSSATNLALIGTTTSPVFSIVLAAMILGERVSKMQITGMLICIAGILYLLSGGNMEKLTTFRFSTGDAWIILAGFFFAVYNIQVRKKPADISPLTFLLATFVCGTLLLSPAFIIDQFYSPAPEFSPALAGVILYLGLGTSVLAFLFWNAAIVRIGAGKTALLGNLIPVFSALEAVVWLNESITRVQLAGGALVLTGLLIANLGKKARLPSTELI